MENKAKGKRQKSKLRSAAALRFAFCLLTFALLSPVTCGLSPAFGAQQAQAQNGQALNPYNAKYVQGVGPGYWPTAGSGLVLNIAAGTALCNNTVYTYAGGTLTLAASATNYVYLDATNACMPNSNTTGFVSTSLPIAVVATNSAAIITHITDVRTWFSYNAAQAGNGGTVVWNTPSATAQGNISATNMLASASAEHAYFFGWQVSLVNAGSGCSGSTIVQLDVTFTDPNSAASTTQTLGTVTIAANGNGVPGFVSSGMDYVVAKSGSAVQYSTANYTSLGTGCSVNPGYQVIPTLVQMW